MNNLSFCVLTQTYCFYLCMPYPCWVCCILTFEPLNFMREACVNLLNDEDWIKTSHTLRALLRSVPVYAYWAILKFVYAHHKTLSASVLFPNVHNWQFLTHACSTMLCIITSTTDDYLFQQCIMMQDITNSAAMATTNLKVGMSRSRDIVAFIIQYGK